MTPSPSELAALGGARFTPARPAPRKATFFCLGMVQLVESVFVELNLHHRADRENPVNAGWLSSKVAAEGPNPFFRQFFESLRIEASPS